VDSLIDTQLLLWLAFKREKLPSEAANFLQSGEATIYFSQVSIWEVSIKAALGRPDFQVDPRQLVRGLLAFGAEQMDIKNQHLFAVASLPRLHGDPFDRLLVAQAQVEGVRLLTTDGSLQSYGAFVKQV
jgi:PIN domain nuclease of toxin-antitoxin system